MPENSPQLNNVEHMRMLCSAFQSLLRDILHSDAVGIYDPDLVKRIENAVTTDIGRVRHF